LTTFLGKKASQMTDVGSAGSQVPGNFIKPGKVYDAAGFGTDACFTHDLAKFCTRFGSDGAGGVVCTAGGPVKAPAQTLQTSAALVFCDSETPGCGARPSLHCRGTSEPCLPGGAVCPGVDCAPSEGFMPCPVASGAAAT
jgi:hypothetical protein